MFCNLRVVREGSTYLRVGVVIDHFQGPVGSEGVAEIVFGAKLQVRLSGISDFI